MATNISEISMEKEEEEDKEKTDQEEVNWKKEGVVLERVEIRESSVTHAHSVPPTPTRVFSQREWSVERPHSAQGKAGKVTNVPLSPVLHVTQCTCMISPCN